MSLVASPHDHPFLRGGGEMGKLTREYDWSKTAIGSPDQWPQSLSTTVGILLNSRFPMFLWWGDELIQFYNDAYRPSMGNDGKHPAALGQRGEECWPEIWPVIKPLIDQVRAGGESTWAEDQLIPIYRNGQMEDVYWTFSYSPVRDEAGAIKGLLVVCSETTHKVITLNQLGESERQLRFAMEAAELGAWDLNPVTNKVNANERLREWFGIDPHVEFQLQFALDVIHEQDKEFVTKQIARALEYDSGGTYDIEYTIVHPVTKEPRIVRAKGKAWFNEHKVPYRFNGTLQDVTAQAIAIRKLADSEARFRTIVEQAPVAIALLAGKEMIVETVNAQILDAWGRDRSVLGLPLEKAVPELKGQPFLDLLAGVYNTGIAHYAYDMPAKLVRNGVLEDVYSNFVYAPMRNTDGEIYGVMVLASIITEQVLNRQKLDASQKTFTEELSRQVQERTEQLAAINAELHQSNESLRHSNEELAQYAYVASHDLQEPLRKIRIFSSMLDTNNLPEDQQLLVNKIINASERMRLLINDLLQFSRLLKSDTLYKPVHLSDIVSAVINDFELVIEGKDATVDVGPLPVIAGIGLQMNQLFYNLLSNALKFTLPDRKPHVRISAALIDLETVKLYIDKPFSFSNYYLVSISDNGIGFDSKYAKQIFEVFKRLHARDVFPGSGIGLALCRRIVATHNGYLYVDAIPGEGATFYIILPEKQYEMIVV